MAIHRPVFRTGVWEKIPKIAFQYKLKQYIICTFISVLKKLLTLIRPSGFLHSPIVTAKVLVVRYPLPPPLLVEPELCGKKKTSVSAVTRRSE